MRALVTGGAGYIGTHLCHALRREGHEVLVLDDFSTGKRGNVPAACTIVEADLCDLDRVRECLGGPPIGIVYHLAAKILPEESIKDPLTYYQNNTVATLGLVRAAKEQGVTKFVFASTAAVYGNPSEARTSENAMPSPISPYGRSKLYAEGFLNDLADDSFHVGILRFFNVAGRENGVSMERSGQPTHLISRVLDIVSGKSDSLTVFGRNYQSPDGTPVRDYIHVRDLATALIAVGKAMGNTEHTVFNVGYDRGYSVLEVIRAAESVFATSIPYRFGPRRPGDIAHMVADSTRIREETDWVPSCDRLEDIFRSYCE